MHKARQPCFLNFSHNPRFEPGFFTSAFTLRLMCFFWFIWSLGNQDLKAPAWSWRNTRSFLVHTSGLRLMLVTCFLAAKENKVMQIVQTHIYRQNVEAPVDRTNINRYKLKTGNIKVIVQKQTPFKDEALSQHINLWKYQKQTRRKSHSPPTLVCV